jgi:hypothetical protein
LAPARRAACLLSTRRSRSFSRRRRGCALNSRLSQSNSTFWFSL